MTVINTEHVKAKSSDQNNKAHRKNIMSFVGKQTPARPTHSVAPHYSAEPADGTISLLLCAEVVISSMFSPEVSFKYSFTLTNCTARFSLYHSDHPQ